MASLTESRPRPGLPGRQIRPFPARNPSYRALSIIDAYSADLRKSSFLDVHQEEGAIAPRSAPSLEYQNGSLQESYMNDLDIDEAYGSGEADFPEDDMSEVINLDDYDPYRSTTPPPRNSSRKLPDVKIDTKTEIYEVKPELPPKSNLRKGDYDPFKAPSPPRNDVARVSVKELASRSDPTLATIERGALSPAVPPKDGARLPAGTLLANAMKSSSNLSTMSNARSIDVQKALPTVPSLPRKLLASPMPKENKPEEKALPQPVEERKASKVRPGLPKRPDEGVKKDSRKDSMIQSDKGSSPVASSPQSRRSPSSTPKSSFEQEATIRVPRGIRRTSKPATLTLTKSNGSTVTSGEKSSFEAARPAPKVLPSMKLASLPQDESSASIPLAPSQTAPFHVATNVASAASLPLNNNNLIDFVWRQSPIEQQSPTVDQFLSPVNDSSAPPKDEPEMQRIKNFVKRKPVGGSTSSASSSTFSKENTNPHRSLSPSKVTTVLSSQQSQPYQERHIRHESSKSDALARSPASDRTLEPFPALETHASSLSTIRASDAKRPTTPPVLRSPTPLSQLEESPSRYGLKKKSERNLKSVTEERQSQMFGQGANGVLRFLTAQKALRDSFSDEVPVSPIFDANTVVTNESKRKTFYHASLLGFLKERPRDSNAPQLGTTQLHCHNDHMSQWHTNSNEIHPVNCSLCDVQGGPRWSCGSCGLRVCQDCCEAIKARMENTELSLLLKGSKEETERLRAEVASRRARSNTERTITPSRPGSPVVYPPSDGETPYVNQGAATSTQSLPGIMQPRNRPPEQRGHMYPPSAFNNQRIPYGRPAGHRNRMSISSLSARDTPPTPRIPDQYLNNNTSNPSLPRTSRGSEIEMRGRMRPSPERGRYPSEPRYDGSMRAPSGERRDRSRPRPSRGMEIDPMADLRGPMAGPYAAVQRSAGVRTPGIMR